MRRVAEANGVRVKAYAGTTGVLLAFDVEPGKREDLLGFAVSREILSGRFAGRIGWLQGILDFPGTSKARGELIATNVAPIQKFRWSDYSVYPDTQYAYTVQPAYRSGTSLVTGSNRRLFLEAGPRVVIETQGFQGEDAIIFNRAVASSQAFSRRFPDLDLEIQQAKEAGMLASKTLPQRALDWLSRGLVEQIESFLAQADDERWAIDLAIYEYHLPRLHQAMVAAGKRGVKVRILYHAKEDDDATAENKHLLHDPAIPGAILFPRVTTAIMHNKFAVLSRIEPSGRYEPVAALAGSTNWTENGCYRQANVVHISRSPAILENYAAMFETLIATSTNRRATKNWINKNNKIPTAPERFGGFSPRSKFADIHAMATLIAGAKRDVLFATAFKLRDEITDALLGAANDSILRMGVQNSSSAKITGIHRDRTAHFTATSLLPGGLEGWLKETTAKQKGTIRVHTKAIVIDVTSEAPLIISGSHNFSTNASKNNDENYLIIRRDRDVADVYLCEIMRIYDHYRFRFSAREKVKAGEPTAPPSLSGDDSWCNDYFTDGSLKSLDRIRFSGY
ncbi:MAG: phospholipase [Proteobacteria bacterium]|nr:phospholipase [Pseudomonadota bacterium]MBU1231359.1 phospholipase [Pseudomonadota bacterium]MBU1419610.1 phospholipase [Pseudomonadota bacterium]MBU1453895.1 phospholipase [Pseudomonadota bacterium]